MFVKYEITSLLLSWCWLLSVVVLCVGLPFFLSVLVPVVFTVSMLCFVCMFLVCKHYLCVMLCACNALRVHVFLCCLCLCMLCSVCML